MVYNVIQLSQLEIEWDEGKNRQLKAERGYGFEEVEAKIRNGEVVDVVDHHNQVRYPGQRIIIIEMNDYVYLVPCVMDTNKVFLKTLFKSRKATKLYLGEKK